MRLLHLPRYLTVVGALLACFTLSACQDAVVDAPLQTTANAGGGFACSYDAYITGPGVVFSYGQFRYTLKWTITSSGFAETGCQLTATSLGLRNGTPSDVQTCGSGTTSQGFPYIDVCTDYAPDGFTFYVDGSVRYFNGVDSHHNYDYASKTVVFDNDIGATEITSR